jgi:hypothetical protein
VPDNPVSSIDIDAALRRRTEAAQENLLRQRAKFDEIVEAIQHGVAPDTDGAQRLRDAGFDVAGAREALVRAVSEFHEYLLTGIVPNPVTSAEMK